MENNLMCTFYFFFFFIFLQHYLRFISTNVTKQTKSPTCDAFGNLWSQAKAQWNVHGDYKTGWIYLLSKSNRIKFSDSTVTHATFFFSFSSICHQKKSMLMKLYLMPMSTSLNTGRYGGGGGLFELIRNVIYQNT